MKPAGNSDQGIVIHIEGLVRHYPMGTTVVKALRGVDLEIHSGELLAITGPSGSGKSTLMHLIGCLDTPTSGRILIEGEDVSEMNQNQLALARNKKIGFVFQQFNLLSKIDILDNVMTPLMYARVPFKQRREQALEALKRVGLAERVHHRPTELSGGQRQRVAIARALVNRPSLILADEPTGALDTETGKTILDIFKALHKEGNTVVMVTHDPDVSAMCRRVIHLRDGKLENSSGH